MPEHSSLSNSSVSMGEQPQSSTFVKKENEPWRGSSGFGLANILNRNVSAGNNPPAPTFSLPSLHSIGKPLGTKESASMANHTTSAQASTSGAASKNQESSSKYDPLPDVPMATRKSSPKDSQKKSGSSRRIAPAPADEEENENTEEEPTSIRGGRWTADEHERFLAGFRVHGHKWKRVQQVVRTRSVTQVRTHAQKYLLKLAKLKAEKKQKGDGSTGTGSSSPDVEVVMNTVPSTPDRLAPSTDDDSSSRHSSPKSYKRNRKNAPSNELDEEYIAAAATTLCFLMRQKIDSLFDARGDGEADLEPYHCYGEQRDNDVKDDTPSRKRNYMQFAAENAYNASNELEYSYETVTIQD